jgi:DNA-nicking Smr family endonuclease
VNRNKPVPASKPRWNALADLNAVKKVIADRAQREAALVQQQATEAKRLAALHNLFQNAVGPVTTLQSKRRVDLRPLPPQPVPQQQQKDEKAAFLESLSDEVDISTLLHTDAQLSYARPGIGPDVVQKLRRGEWAIQRQIDLHGLRTPDAREALGTFIRDAHKHGVRCVRVVHGKGLGSPGKTPVLKDKVHRWLVQKSEVIVFVQAPPAHGGSGALLVLLQTSRGH